MSDPCRTIRLPHPGHIAPDLEDFLADHFVTPDGRCLPSPEEPWSLSFNLRRGVFLKCEACGNLARGGVLVGMRHRRTTGELWCCRPCSFRLNSASREVIAREDARPEHPETRTIRGYVDRLRDLSKWSTPTPGVQLMDPGDHTRISLDGSGEGWTWRVRVRFVPGDQERIEGHTATIQQAFTEAGWAWLAADRVRLLMERDRADEAHAFACEVADHLDWLADNVDGPRRLTGPEH